MPIRFALTIACVASLSWGLSACGEEKTSATSPSLSKADASYDARGMVRKILKPSDSSKAQGEAVSLMIQHEALPDFRDKSGKKVGMKAMTMSFTVAPKVSLKNVKTGDKISFRFEVRWSGDEPPLRLTRVSKLSADTKLNF